MKMDNFCNHKERDEHSKLKYFINETQETLYHARH